MPGEERDILLIVDDDAINRAILEQIFADDYGVLEAENGRAGLARILEGPERLCAVLLDVVMPEMDGLEVLRRLNREGLLDRLPVFLITAEASGNPCIGLREPLMAERPEGFRSVVVHRNCKLVYYVDGDTVYIADVWDTRREPLIQADNVK